MHRIIVPAMLVFLLTGCGDGSGDSYTAKALDEYRAGKTADWTEKGKRPSAKEVASYQKKLKNWKAGSKNDLFQALWLLSNYRDHEEYVFNTAATSTYPRATYLRVFGEPDEKQDKVTPNTWSHACTDGKVTLRGFLKVNGQPANMQTYPHKPEKKR